MKRLIIENEEARLNALRNLQLLETPPSDSFDRITRLASRLFDAPVSTVSLTDHDRQWFKSIVGADLVELPRSEAPCNYAIHNDEVFIVPDLLEDARFNSGQMARAGIRFYAGAPLITQSGYSLGTLCVMDGKPRALSDDERRVLVDLAAMVMAQIELQNTIGRVDPTTGLPNEYRLFEDMEGEVKRHPGSGRVGVLVELVSGAQVGQGLRALGASYIEELVRRGMETVRKTVDGGAIVYHVGRTRCLVLLDEVKSPQWEELAQDIERRLRDTTLYSNIQLTPDPAMGFYRFALGEVAPRDVLRRLFGAVADARQTGRLFATYDAVNDRRQARSFTLLTDMQTLVERPGELSLAYQPVVDMRSGLCVGAEALVRWRHKVLGEVSPTEFIGLAEGTAFMRSLTQWVLDTAIARARAWENTPFGRISINVSGRNLEEDDFADRVFATLERYGVGLNAVQLEFTESALITYSVRARSQLDELRQAGIAIVIDDFGTGYNGLSGLRQMPASAIKIDQSFVRLLGSDERDRKLVRAMICLAHDLGFRVVAEGVEDRAAYDLLAAWGCDEAQGFFISRPMTPDNLVGWAETRDAKVSSMGMTG
jgi:EAL domain-containing protein (putative c-di-GMP-specific phosphodiesterase class I)/GGDEF domain-containing protein